MTAETHTNVQNLTQISGFAGFSPLAGPPRPSLGMTAAEMAEMVAVQTTSPLRRSRRTL